MPLAAVTLAMLSLFPVFSEWMSWIQHFVYSNFVPAAGDAGAETPDAVRHQGRAPDCGRPGVRRHHRGDRCAATVEQTFNDIWRVPNARKLLHRVLAYWALLTLGPILIAVALTVTTHLFTALPFAARTEKNIVNALLPLAVELVGVLLLYVVVPNVTVRWRHALAGALFATVLIEIARRLFAAAMKTFTSYQVIYGAIAALPVFLVWIYISWVIVLLGAIVAATLRDGKAGD
ncbi:MAG: YihY family inner membrane protein [Comamonadaceae bacterium]|nr:YihY family inner membrane protein [Comamonadaceae bacterium]